MGQHVSGGMRLSSRTLPSFHQLRVGKGIPWHLQASLTDCPSSMDTVAGSAEEKDGGTAGDERRGAAHRWHRTRGEGQLPTGAPSCWLHTTHSSAGLHTKNQQASPAQAPCGNNNLDSPAIKQVMLLIARGLQQRMTEHPAPATQAGQAQVGQTQPY